MPISPVRYFFSRALLFPRNERIRRLTWPALVRTAKPPLPSWPALLETAVSECRLSAPLRLRAPMIVSIRSNACQISDLPSPQRVRSSYQQHRKVQIRSSKWLTRS